MRNKKIIAALISLLTVIIMMFTVTVTAFATEEYIPEEEQQITEAYEPDYEPETEYVPEENPAILETEPEEQGVVEEETQALDNQPLNELPQVESHEVVIPTTVKLPDIEVSDTSLLGGVIAWLCVAVGIAVIAGVLVSQRTRQVGSNNSQSNRRR